MEEERERKTAHARRDKPFGKYASTILPYLITNPTRFFIGHFSFYTIFLIVATKRSHHQHKEKEYKISFEKFDSFFFQSFNFLALKSSVGFAFYFLLFSFDFSNCFFFGSSFRPGLGFSFNFSLLLIAWQNRLH